MIIGQLSINNKLLNSSGNLDLTTMDGIVDISNKYLPSFVPEMLQQSHTASYVSIISCLR